MSLPFNIVTVIGNPSAKSRTKVVAQALTEGAADALAPYGVVHQQSLEIAQLGPAIGAALNPAALPLDVAEAIRAIESADLLIAATPVYKGAYTGLFKHLFDLVGPNALVGKPVVLAANGGSDRHALVVDHQLRPLFAFFRALTVPSAVYAAESDFDGYTLTNPALRARIAEAVSQAANLTVGQRHLAARIPQRLAA